MSETLWQKAYDDYVHENSYQGKLEKENKRLKAKLYRIEQIVKDYDGTTPSVIKQFSEIQKVLERSKVMSKETIIADTGLNQFDGNPTDSPDLMEEIANTWIEKALYYGIKKCGGFSWRESWVVVDGIKYNISINNTEIMGDRDCAGLEIELRKLREKINKAIDEIDFLRQHRAKYITEDNKVCIDSKEVLKILKNIGE